MTPLPSSVLSDAQQWRVASFYLLISNASDIITEQQSTFAMLVQVDAMLDKTICALCERVHRIIRFHLHGGHLLAAKGLGFSVPLRRV
jgi:hypothetical protein